MGKIIPFPSPPEQEEIVLNNEEKKIYNLVQAQLFPFVTQGYGKEICLDMARLSVCFLTSEKASQKKIIAAIEQTFFS